MRPRTTLCGLGWIAVLTAGSACSAGKHGAPGETLEVNDAGDASTRPVDVDVDVDAGLESSDASATEAGPPDAAEAQPFGDAGQAAPELDSGSAVWLPNGWAELDGPPLGDGSDPPSYVRKPLAITLDGVAGYRAGRAFALQPAPGISAITVLIELTNESDALHCEIEGALAWKSASAELLHTTSPDPYVMGSTMRGEFPSGEVYHRNSCLAPGELGYIAIEEVIPAEQMMFDRVASLSLRLAHAPAEERALPGFVVAATSYSERDSPSDPEEHLLTLTVANQGALSAPIGAGTRITYLLLDADGLPIAADSLVPDIQAGLAPGESVTATHSFLLFGSSHRMLVNVCISACPHLLF